MKSLKELLEIDKREREIEHEEKAMAVVALITVVLGVIIVGLIVAALAEVSAWTK